MTVGTRTSNNLGKSRSFWCISIVSLSSEAKEFFALKSTRHPNENEVSYTEAEESERERGNCLPVSLDRSLSAMDWKSCPANAEP